MYVFYLIIYFNFICSHIFNKCVCFPFIIIYYKFYFYLFSCNFFFHFASFFPFYSAFFILVILICDLPLSSASLLTSTLIFLFLWCLSFPLMFHFNHTVAFIVETHLFSPDEEILRSFERPRVFFYDVLRSYFSS